MLAPFRAASLSFRKIVSVEHASRPMSRHLALLSSLSDPRPGHAETSENSDFLEEAGERGCELNPPGEDL